MKKIYTLAFISIVTVMTSACTQSSSPERFSLEFKNNEDLIAWLNEKGHGAEFVSGKFYQLVGAIDGGNFLINGTDHECYIFDDKKYWENFPETMKEMGSTATPQSYHNAICAQT